MLAPERLGVDGLLGVDMLENRNVIMDFNKKRLEVRRSTALSGAFPGVREVSVLADARFGRLAVANARVSGVRCVAFIDSGSGASMGNMALAEAIELRVRRKPEPAMAIRLIGAAGEATLGELRVVRSIEMGALRMTNLPLVLADLHIFDVSNLNSRPAVLLGVDVLRMFARVELDFGADRVKFRLGKGLDAADPGSLGPNARSDDQVWKSRKKKKKKKKRKKGGREGEPVAVPRFAPRGEARF